jgi:hypothetical protein
MATAKQIAAARRNNKKAAAAAHLPKRTRIALGKQAAKVAR